MGKLGREIARDEAATGAKIAGASQRLLGQEESDGNNSERMHFDLDHCPKCSGDPRSVIETVECKVFLEPDGKGGFVYDTSDIDVIWETQAPLIEDGRVTLVCRKCGDIWSATMPRRLTTRRRKAKRATTKRTPSTLRWKSGQTMKSKPPGLRGRS